MKTIELFDIQHSISTYPLVSSDTHLIHPIQLYRTTWLPQYCWSFLLACTLQFNWMENCIYTNTNMAMCSYKWCLRFIHMYYSEIKQTALHTTQVIEIMNNHTSSYSIKLQITTHHHFPHHHPYTLFQCCCRCAHVYQHNPSPINYYQWRRELAF